MASNHTTTVCIPCRNVIGYGLCPECGAERVTVYKWSAPKKNNDRAWKRIEKGEWLWDRRRVSRQKMRRNAPETVIKKEYHTETVVDCDCGDFFCHWRHKQFKRVLDGEREVTNFRASPDIDMGG